MPYPSPLCCLTCWLLAGSTGAQQLYKVKRMSCGIGNVFFWIRFFFSLFFLALPLSHASVRERERERERGEGEGEGERERERVGGWVGGEGGGGGGRKGGGETADDKAPSSVGWSVSRVPCLGMDRDQPPVPLLHCEVEVFRYVPLGCRTHMPEGGTTPA